MSSNDNDAHVSLNPLRMLCHIQKDKEWQKLTAEALLKSDTEEWANPNTTKLFEENDEVEELTVRKLMQQIENSRNRDKIWKDKGRSRLLKLLGEREGTEEAVFGVGPPAH